MKYQITHTCGHDEQVELFGKGTDRQSKIAWMEQQDCRACRNGAANVAATKANEANEAAGLPTLTGSEKQVSWAETVRTNQLAMVVRELDNVAAAMARQGKSEAQIATDRAPIDAMVAKVQAQTSAAWWIDHRSDSLQTLLKAAQ